MDNPNDLKIMKEPLSFDDCFKTTLIFSERYLEQHCKNYSEKEKTIVRNSIQIGVEYASQQTAELEASVEWLSDADIFKFAYDRFPDLVNVSISKASRQEKARDKFISGMSFAQSELKTRTKLVKSPRIEELEASIQWLSEDEIATAIVEAHMKTKELHLSFSQGAHWLQSELKTRTKLVKSPRIKELEAEVKKLKSMLENASNHIKWCMENLHLPHTSDHFNIPTNAIQEIDEALNK